MNEIETQNQEELNPLLTLWLHPKKTTRYVLDKKSLLYVILFLCLGFIGSGFTGFIDWDIYPEFPLWGILLITLILSPILGIISTAFSALCIWLIGKIFKGKATFQQTFKAISLSAWPFIILIPIYIIWMLVDPNSLFNISIHFGIISIIGILFTIVVTIWSIVIAICAIAEAHQFSNWKSFFTLLLLTLIIFIILFAIGILIGIIAILFGIALMA